PVASEVSTLSLHDALPISISRGAAPLGSATVTDVGDYQTQLVLDGTWEVRVGDRVSLGGESSLAVGEQWRSEKVDFKGKVSGGSDRKSTRLNSSHVKISYA